MWNSDRKVFIYQNKKKDFYMFCVFDRIVVDLFTFLCWSSILYDHSSTHSNLFFIVNFSAFHLFKFSACTFIYTSIFHIDNHDAIFFNEMLKFFNLNSNLKIDDDEFEKLKKNWKIRLTLKKMMIKKNLCLANEKFYLKTLIEILIRTNFILLKN